jgi:osmoprotectant transport system permease protein
MSNLIDVFRERQDQLVSAIFEHIQLSFIALFFAVIISIPLGVYITRKPKIAEGIIGITAVLQTIPSLALLGLLIPLLGIGKIPAIIALIIYALLPIIRNTFTGINEIDRSLIEAAQGMGMTPKQRLLRVELPLAMPVIMAGIRTATVLIIGTATLAALIGGGGLGELIMLGIDRNDSELIILGAVPAAILAIIFDILLKKLGRVSFKKSLIIITVFIVATLSIMIVPSITNDKKENIVIGGKLGSEPEILINMYKLLIEQDTDLHVELKPGLGKTSFVYNALKSGSIDIYPEFTGTAIVEFLKEEPISTNQEQVYEQARKGMDRKFNLELLEPMEYNNTYALAVSNQFAKTYDLKTISDLQSVESQVKAGFTGEFSDREDGYKGIQKLYHLSFPTVATMEPKLRYRATQTGDVNVVDAYSTDSELREYNLTVLKDDKHLFPPYQGAPLLREETLDEHPELADTLNKLSGKISDNEMREMNYKVNVEGISPQEVAKDYLKKVKLIK